MSELPQRVVSLVPSLTESIAVTCPGLLVGVTDWCTHPEDLAAVRLRGTKNPDIAGVVALQPDLVVVNTEENRVEDIAVLRDAGLPVWETDPETVPAALRQLRALLRALGATRVTWLDEADRRWASILPMPRRRAVVPIWRRPWMALGRDTFAGDVLDRLGIENVLADSTDRYPRIDLAVLPTYDLVVLPDEPYPFSADDGPEAFDLPSALVSGRHLTWYGPSLVDAPDVLLSQLDTAPSGDPPPPG